MSDDSARPSRPVTYKRADGAVFLAPLGTPFPTATAADGSPLSMGPDGVTKWVRIPGSS